MEERKRLMDGKPSLEQMKTWWTGGLVEFRKEMNW
jgi:hypothetical protein